MMKKSQMKKNHLNQWSYYPKLTILEVKLIPWNTTNRRIGCWIGWLLPKSFCLFFLLLQTKASKRNPTSNNTRCEDHLSILAWTFQ
jgi:hypothetical protein